MQFLTDTFKIDYNLPKYSNPKSKGRINGDIAGILKIRDLLPPNNDTEYIYQFEKNNKICLGNINRYSLESDQCIIVDNPQIQATSPQYIINDEASNNLRLLLICDSFATASSKFYTRTFKETWIVHHEYINGKKLAKFVKKLKPDIVIYQIVEREFYYPNLLDNQY